ncbi:MAG: outer membrane beta-barrel protein [Saprospiraceae bacterium]|nr:outer membrane beta-barrel protein [Saprospiraceae bacterium]
MKKIIALTFLLTFLYFSKTSAQVNLSFSTGLNWSNIRLKTNQKVDTKSRFGFFAEVSPNYRFNDKFRVLLNCQFSQKGYQNSNPLDPLKTEYKYSYVDIIPEVEYSFLQNLIFGLGVNYGILLDEQIKDSSHGWIKPNIKSIKSSDFGLVGKVKAGYKNMYCFLRYNLGLSNITDLIYTDEGGNLIDNTSLINKNWQLGVGYNLDFKRS